MHLIQRVTSRSFIAIHDIPDGMSREAFQHALERLALESRDIGLRPKETFFTYDGREVVTYLRAATPEDVIAAHERAGLPTPRVHEGERIFTELLSEPHRAH